jgi:hypothetical protein
MALEEAYASLRRVIDNTVPMVIDHGTPISEVAHGELVSHGTLESNKHRSWYSVNSVYHVKLHWGSDNRSNGHFSMFWGSSGVLESPNRPKRAE